VGTLGPEILAVVATPAYAGGRGVAALLAFSFVMVGLGYIAGLGLGLARKTAPTGIAVTGAALLNLALNLVLTPRLGIEGAALSALLSQAAVPAYLFHRAQREYPIPYRFGPALGILALAAAVTWAGVSWSAGSVVATVAGKLVLLSLFVPALFVLGIVPPGQAAAVLRRVRPGAAR
jgi:O-antigen/teichoic acid export membrane protein